MWVSGYNGACSRKYCCRIAPTSLHHISKLTTVPKALFRTDSPFPPPCPDAFMLSSVVAVVAAAVPLPGLDTAPAAAPCLSRCDDDARGNEHHHPAEELQNASAADVGRNKEGKKPARFPLLLLQQYGRASAPAAAAAAAAIIILSLLLLLWTEVRGTPRKSNRDADALSLLLTWKALACPSRAERTAAAAVAAWIFGTYIASRCCCSDAALAHYSSTQQQ